jgi:hypothetical protein
MAMLDKYGDDTRLEMTTPPLSLDDEIKLSKESYSRIIEDIKIHLEMTETQAKVAFEQMNDGVDPSLESFPKLPMFDEDLIPTIGNEDFKQRMMDILDAFITWIKRIGKWLNDVLDAQSIKLFWLREQVKQLKFDLLQKPQKSTKDFVFKGDVAYISIRYEPVKSISDITAGLSSLKDHLTVYYDYVKTVSANINTLLASVTGNSHYSSDLTQLLEDMSPLKLKSKLAFTEAKDVNYASESKQLLGNLRILIHQPKNVSRLSDINAIGISLSRARTSSGTVPNSVTFKRSDRQTVSRCIAQMENVIDTLLSAFKGDTRKKYDMAIKDLNSEIQKLKSDIRRTGEFEGGELSQKLAVLRTVVEWVTKPYQSLATNSIRITRTAYFVCRQNQSASN